MRQQWFAFRTGKSLSYNSTYREDLPKSGYLSSIFLEVRGAGVTDAFNALEKWRVMDFINSIKVVATNDDIIKSFTGRCLQALMCDKSFAAARVQEFNYGSSTKRFRAWLDFGRYPGDTQYGLNLSRYDNVEIQISNDATVSEFASGFSVDLYLMLLRDWSTGGGFNGYFRTEEYRKLTTVQSKTDYVDLQTQGKLRRMLLQVDPTVDAAENAQRSLYQTLNNVKMTLQDGKEEHINCNPRLLWDLSYMQGRDVSLVGGEPYHSNGQGIRTGLGQTLYKAIGQMPQGGTPGASTIALEPGNDSSTQKMLRTGSDNYSQLWLGHGPENTFPICFDSPEDIEENYLDLQQSATAQLELETGSNANDAAATIRVVTDRLITG